MNELNEFLKQSVADYRAKIGENVTPDIHGQTVNLIIKLPMGASEAIVKAIAHTLAHVVVNTLNNDAPELPSVSRLGTLDTEKYLPHLDKNRNR